MLLIGDQTYGDGIEEWWPTADWRTRYVNRYHQLWTYWPVREVLRHTPTYMIFDDHEIKDDWGTALLEEDPAEAERRLEAGKEAYRLFQQAHNPGGYAGTFHYDFRWGPASFFVMDVRSARSLEPEAAAFPVLGGAQYEALLAWVRSDATRAADIVFLVTPVPIAFIPVEDVRRIIRELGGDLGMVGGSLAGALAGIAAGPVGIFVGAAAGA